MKISTFVIVIVSIVGLAALGDHYRNGREARGERIDRFCFAYRDELHSIVVIPDTAGLRDRMAHLASAAASRLCLGTEPSPDARGLRSAADRCWIKGGGDACYLDYAGELFEAYDHRQLENAP